MPNQSSNNLIEFISGSFIKVDIDYPRLYVDAYVVNNGNSTLSRVKKFKCHNSDRQCDWRPIEYDVSAQLAAVNKYYLRI